jgi:hypothetical protein
MWCNVCCFGLGYSCCCCSNDKAMASFVFVLVMIDDDMVQMAWNDCDSLLAE